MFAKRFFYVCAALLSSHSPTTSGPDFRGAGCRHLPRDGDARAKSGTGLIPLPHYRDGTEGLERVPVDREPKTLAAPFYAIFEQCSTAGRTVGSTGA
jgi:hypothetical protein